MKIRKFNVIRGNFNTQKMEKYDVIPYLVNCYREARRKDKPKTFDEFREFVRHWAMYQWWGRCEYEIVLEQWPLPETRDAAEKWDVFQQVDMNLDVVTELVIESLGKRVTRNKRSEETDEDGKDGKEAD